MKKLLLAVSFLLAMLTLLILPVTANATANNVSVNTAVATSSTNSNKCIYPANLGKNTSTLNSSVDPRTTTKASQATVTDEQSEKPGTATTDNQSEKLETATTDEQSEKPNTVTTNDQSQKPATVTSDVTKIQNPTAKAEKTDPNHSNESFKEAVAPAVFVPEISYKSGETDFTNAVSVKQTLSDPDGTVIDSNYKGTIYDTENLNLKYNFTVPKDIVDKIKGGDFFTVSVPDALSFKDTDQFDVNLQGIAVPIAHYQLVKQPKSLKVTFTDYLQKHIDVTSTSGVINISGVADAKKPIVISQEGGLPPVTVPVQPKPKDYISNDPYGKTGPIEKEGYQVPDVNGEVNWTLNVNMDGLAEALGTGNISTKADTDHVMKNATVYDNLPSGQTIAQDSAPRLSVPIYFKDKNGRVLSTSGTAIGVNLGKKVTLADVANANHESDDAVTFDQFNTYIKSNLGSYGFFKQTKDGNLFGPGSQANSATQYKAGDYTFVMNVGDLGVKDKTDTNKLSLTTTKDQSEQQIRDNFKLKTGFADPDQTVNGFEKLLTATGGSGIVGLHIEFRMKEETNLPKADLNNTAIVAHDGHNDTSKTFIIHYKNTSATASVTVAQGAIGIRKVDADDNSKGLSGVQFTVIGPNYDKTITTDDNGFAQTESLLSGTYTVTEITPAKGYSPYIVKVVTGKDKPTSVLVSKNKDGKSSFTVTIDRTTDSQNSQGQLFTVSDKKGTTNINVTKIWKGVPAGVSAPEVTVTLYANGKATDKTLKLTKENGYKGSFTDLEQLDANGKTIQYNVVEQTKNVPDIYVAGNFGVAEVRDGVYTLTNTLKTNIKVTKTWVNVPANNNEPNVTVTLLTNGKATQTMTLTAANHYTGTFAKLDLMDAKGQLINYSVQETPVAGYTAENNGFINVPKGQVDFLAKLVNDYNRPPVNPNQPVTNVKVVKNWEGVPAGTQTPDITVTLLADGESTGKTLVLTSKNHYTGSFTDLALTDANAKTIVYSVKETPVAGYTAENGGVATAVNGTATLVNDYDVPGKPEKPQTPPTPPVTPPTPENPNTPNIPNTPITPEEPKNPNVPETPETTTDQNRVSTPSKNEANTPVASVHGEAVAPRKQDNVQPKLTEAKLPQTSEKQSSSAALIGVALLLMLFVPMTLLKKKA